MCVYVCSNTLSMCSSHVRMRNMFTHTRSKHCGTCQPASSEIEIASDGVDWPFTVNFRSYLEDYGG